MTWRILSMIIALFLCQPLTAAAQGFGQKVSVSVYAEARLDRTAVNDFTCPEHFSPVTFHAAVGHYGGVRTRVSRIRRSNRLAGFRDFFTPPTARFESNIEVSLPGCLLGHHFLPVRIEVGLEIEGDGQTVFAEDFGFDDGISLPYWDGYQAFLMGTNRFEGFWYASKPLVPVGRPLGQLNFRFYPVSGRDDPCIELEGCWFGFDRGDVALVLTD